MTPSGNPPQNYQSMIFSLNSWRKNSSYCRSEGVQDYARKYTRKKHGKKTELLENQGKLPVVGLLVLGLCLIIISGKRSNDSGSNTVNTSGVTVPVFNPSLNVTAALTPLETLSATV